MESYGEAVHKFCASKKIAPELIICEQATSRFKIVVMEEVRNAKLLYDCIRKNKHKAKDLFKRKCSDVFVTMHGGGYCHGDFRSTNLLVVQEKDDVRLYIIDFDCAGKAGEAKYPCFINHWSSHVPCKSRQRNLEETLTSVKAGQVTV